MNEMKALCHCCQSSENSGVGETDSENRALEGHGGLGLAGEC